MMKYIENLSLTAQLRYGLLLLAVVCVLGTGSVLIALSFQEEVRQLKIAQYERSQAAAEEIDAYLDDLLRKVGYLARVQGLSEMSQAIHHALLEGLIRQNSAYETVAIVNRRGDVVSEISQYGLSFANVQADSIAFRRAYHEHEDFFGSVEFDQATQLPLVTISVPIRNREDVIDGVLLAKVNLEFLWFVVSNVKVGHTGYAYVIDDRRFLVAQKNGMPESTGPEDLSEFHFVRRLTGRGTPPIESYSGLKGRRVLGAGALIESVNWYVVVELPLIEAYAPIRRLLVVMGGALCLAVAVAIGLGMVFSGQFVQPLKTLIVASKRIQEGLFDVRVPSTGRHELGILATTFNTMTAKLQESIERLEQNILELKRTERERESLIGELETKNAELERFTYTVSHDLKSPLITIKGFLGMLEHDARSGAQERLNSDIQFIAEAADKMAQLLDDLLELSRIGRVVNPSEHISLNDVIDEAQALVKGRLAEHKAQVRVAPDLPSVYGDWLRLREVFENLLDNAAKFMGDRSEPAIEIGVRHDGGEQVIYVKDNGMGIEPHYHAKVFGLFEKLDTGVEGTGIGLATVKRIIELHGGRIWVESEGLGQGSIFCFTLSDQ